MDLMARTIIEAQCHRLAALFCHYVDSTDDAATASLWTKDGTWTTPRSTLTGHDEIKAYLGARSGRMVRHQTVNHVVDVRDEANAVGNAFFSVLIGVPVPDKEGKYDFGGAPLVGAYADTYRKVGETWLFASRRIDMFSAL